MPFKPQIKLLVASKELQTSVTIPNPSEEDRAAFLWLVLPPDELKPDIAAFKVAVREHLAKLGEGAKPR